ncbi:Putative serine peptidase S28 family protein [Zea mays]|uniref:Putative serine peptidase S28 family protein n=1 Tax=Zea mays TaxID=4577 RepID=A0A1D6GAU1_MAIZE|nr:Putative serine peptidase S28 family protein [Zea mays]
MGWETTSTRRDTSGSGWTTSAFQGSGTRTRTRRLRSSSSGTWWAAAVGGLDPAAPSSSTAATRATSPGSPPTPASSGRPPHASPPSSSSPRQSFFRGLTRLVVVLVSLLRFKNFPFETLYCLWCERWPLACVLQHRYYGESMPFGSKAKAYSDSKSLAYLTAEQALADFAVLLTDLKRNLSAEGSPVVLFGGSYGGMLAAWMRLKYPHIAIGALASSAPILQFEDIVPSTIFYDLVSDDFRRESLSCFLTIKDSWKELDDQANEQDGLLKLSKTFHLCQTLKTSGDLSDWLSSAYSYLAMVDYPLPSEFLMPLPANPIKEVSP